MVSIDFSALEKWKALLWDNHPPLYYFLLKFWIGLVGFSEGPVRSFSALCSFATLIALFQYLKKNLNVRWAILGSLLLATNLGEILLAREARMYALLELLTLLQIIFYLDWLQGKNKIPFYLCSAFLFLTHYFSLLVFATEFLYFAFCRKSFSKAHGIWLIALVSASGLAFIGIDWHFLRWQTQSFLLTNFARPIVESLGSTSLWLSGATSLLYGLWTHRSRYKESSFVFMFLPTCIMFVLILIAFTTGRNLFFARYFAWLVPIVVVGFVFVLSKLRLSVIRVALIAVALGLSAYSVPNVYQYRNAPWRDLFAHIKDNPGPIFTTRTKAIVAPYLMNSNLNLYSSDPNYINAINKGRFWIVETYLQGVVSLEPIRKKYQAQGVYAKLWQFQREQSDIAVALEVDFDRAALSE